MRKRRRGDFHERHIFNPVDSGSGGVRCARPCCRRSGNRGRGAPSPALFYQRSRIPNPRRRALLRYRNGHLLRRSSCFCASDSRQAFRIPDLRSGMRRFDVATRCVPAFRLPRLEKCRTAVCHAVGTFRLYRGVRVQFPSL